MADIVPYIAPSATLVVGLSVAYIAWQQWQLERSKLRLDLFDRRYKVFDATRKFLAVIVRDSRFEDSQLFEFEVGTSDAEFLFASDVVDYLAEIRRRANDMRTHQKVHAPMPEGDYCSRHVQAEHDQLQWLGDQLTAMTKTFRPYLGFSQRKMSLFYYDIHSHQSDCGAMPDRIGCRRSRDGAPIIVCERHH
jgi:hypothetical protein